MDHSVRLLHTGFVTHDVKRFVTTRPDGLDFEPGQGVEIAIDEEGWRDEGRPFTPTSLADEPVLEFTIKGYPEHDGVTEQLHRCSLHFSNSTPADVICEKELRFLLGERCHLTCTRESAAGFDDRRIDRAYLETFPDDLDTPVYLCGPPGFVENLHGALVELGVDEDDIVLEE